MQESEDNSSKSRDNVLTVVVPLFNSEDWIAATVELILQETAEINESIEIIVINDGSTDQSIENIEHFRTSGKIRVISTQNQGRFSARATGVEQAKSDYIVFIDSRVKLHPGSLMFIVDSIQRNGLHQLWNARVSLPAGLSTVSYFWEGIEYMAWRKHFRGPQEISVQKDDLDFHPVGTTMFGAPREWLREVNETISGSNVNLHKISDDTKLIRYLVQRGKLNYSPAFSCTYQPRTESVGFSRHAYHRGTVFVDGHLRAGGRYVIPFFLTILLNTLIFVMLIFQPLLTLAFLCTAVFLLVVTLSRLKMPKRAQRALLTYGPIFAPAYFAGILSGILLKIRSKFIAISQVGKK
jgi:glycosyltransferase involved in cell wall biosynthesis